MDKPEDKEPMFMATVMYGMSPEYPSWRPDYASTAKPYTYKPVILPPAPTQDSEVVTAMWTKSGDCPECKGPIFYRLNTEGTPETLRQCAKGCSYAPKTKEEKEDPVESEDDVLI